MGTLSNLLLCFSALVVLYSVFIDQPIKVPLVAQQEQQQQHITSNSNSNNVIYSITARTLYGQHNPYFLTHRSPTTATSSFSSSRSKRNVKNSDKNSEISQSRRNRRQLAGDDHSDDGDDDHGSDDDHSDSSDHVPLFGALEHIDAQLLMLALLLVVGAVLFVEYVFHFLHVFTKESPFNDLIIAIEKELMVVGSTAFALKIFINVSYIAPDWFFALEFADLLVPMFAFANCLLGVALIFCSIWQTGAWSRAYHLKTDELLDEFYDSHNFTTSSSSNSNSNSNSNGSCCSSGSSSDSSCFSLSLSRCTSCCTSCWRRCCCCLGLLLWAPLNHGIAQVEFRILHDIFCDLYKIQRNAFAFDIYAQRVYEKFVLSIVEIRLVNWALFLALLLANMIRRQQGHTIYDCDDNDIGCVDKASARVFAIVGAGMYAITLVFVAVSRSYEVSIFRKRGIRSVKEYPMFLNFVESTAAATACTAAAASAVTADTATTRMDEQDLKRVLQEFHSSGGHQNSSAVMDVLSDISNVVGSGSSWVSSKMLSTAAGSSSSRKNNNSSSEKQHQLPNGVCINDNSNSAVEEQLGINEFAHRASYVPNMTGSITTTAGVAVDGITTTCAGANDGRGSSSSRNSSRPSYAAVAPEPAAAADLEAGGVATFATAAAADDKNLKFVKFNELPAHRISSSKNSSSNNYLPSSAKPHGHYIHQKHDFVRSVFLFAKPELYFESVQLMLMLLALYLSLWLVNFSSSHIPAVYKFFSLLPALLSALNYVFIVKSAALLRAVYEVDKEAVLEVLEQTEGSRLLGDAIRAKLLLRLNLSDPYEQLKVLFTEIDNDKNCSLSRYEFELLMSKLKINFSRKKWNQIYREIDRNYDDLVSFEEFFLFLFPTHSDALSLENHRLKIVKNRVAMKSLRAAAKQNNSWLENYFFCCCSSDATTTTTTTTTTAAAAAAAAAAAESGGTNDARVVPVTNDT